MTDLLQTGLKYFFAAWMLFKYAEGQPLWLPKYPPKRMTCFRALKDYVETHFTQIFPKLVCLR